MEFDKFNPDTDKNIGFRNIDIEEKYDVYKTNSSYFNLDIKVKLFNKSEPYTIIKNLYPYFWKDAYHYIIWINPKYNKFYDHKRILDILCQKFKDFKIKIWENKPNNRSIPHVKHIHIIVKTNSKLLVHY